MTFSALQIFIFELLKFGFHMTFMYAKKILFSKDEIFLEGQKNSRQPKSKQFKIVLTWVAWKLILGSIAMGVCWWVCLVHLLRNYQLP